MSLLNNLRISCRALSQKVMCKISDPVAQRIHRENAERMFLASFVAGLTGTPGKQVRYASPRDIGQALTIALAVQDAEKQGRFNESSYAKFDNSVRLSAKSPSRSRQDDDRSRHKPHTPAVNHLRSQRYKPPHSASKRSTSAARNVQTEAAIGCYECEGLRHFTGECPNRRKNTTILQTHLEKGTRTNVRSVRVPRGESHPKKKVGKSEGKRKIRKTSKS